MKAIASFTFIASLFICNIAFSSTAKPFGPDISLHTPYMDHQTKCEAEDILSKFYLKTGINFFDGDSESSWTCENNKAATARERRCPFPQHSKVDGKDTYCYTNSQVGPVVCIAAPSSIKEVIKFGDKAGNSYQQDVTRPRFKELFILETDRRGYRQDSYFRMDKDGCNINSAIPGGTFEGCVELMESASNGGPLNPFLARVTGKDYGKFCPESRDEKFYTRHIRNIDELARCFANFPRFRSRYANLKGFPY